MFIFCEVPDGAVFSRQMPTKGTLPKSDIIGGAYAHSFMLTGDANVRVTLHAKVGSRKELRSTLKWHMKKLQRESDRVELLLEPAPKNARVTICALSAENTTDPNAVRVQFKGPETANLRDNQMISTRRVRLAMAQAARI